MKQLICKLFRHKWALYQTEKHGPWETKVFVCDRYNLFKREGEMKSKVEIQKVSFK